MTRNGRIIDDADDHIRKTWNPAPLQISSVITSVKGKATPPKTSEDAQRELTPDSDT
jgi:hypothetical protein